MTVRVVCDFYWWCLYYRAFHNEKDQHHKLQLQSLQDRIAQLETNSQSCLKDKTELLDRLSVERGTAVAAVAMYCNNCMIMG